MNVVVWTRRLVPPFHAVRNRWRDEPANPGVDFQKVL